ncbi:MAG: HlyD family secretion protein [Deltaproteobacteria bacterium]|nr:HlyD family secretion protein [Deltaproteobacteria bacterium]
MKFSASPALRRRVSTLVWLVGLCFALLAIAHRPSTQIPALAWAPSVILSAPEDGVLLELNAVLHQAVAVGDIVARFDGAALRARTEVLEAELEALSERELSSLQGQSRRYERDRESAGLELAELSARVAEGEARLRALGEQLSVAERLVAEGVSAAERAQDVRREMEVTQTRVEADRGRLALARQSATRARRRAAAAPGANPWQLEAAERRLSELEARISRLTLRSSVAGQVMETYLAPGEWVKEGGAVVRVSAMETWEVHAWFSSPVAPQGRVGGRAEVRRATGEHLVGTVTSIGNERLLLPEALWLRANTPQWGYRLRIQLSEGVLTPGEPVQVSLVAGA